MFAFFRCGLLLAVASFLHAQSPEVLQQLRYGEAPQRIAAAKQLIHPHPRPETVAALVAALRDPEPSVRIAVLTTIEYINRPSADIVQPAGRLLADPDLAVVHRALRLLANLSFRGAVAAPDLRLLLRHKAPEVRGEAISVLTPLVNVTQVASDALVGAIDDEAPVNRAAAASGLANSGSVPDTASSRLTALMLDDDDAVRRQSARAIGLIDAPDAEALAALTQALRDDSPAVVQAAQEALRHIESAATR
jgi:HEAT repeat protein